MKLLPDPQQSRPLAIGLLAVAVMLVYFVGFHWFVMRHVSLGGEIDDLEALAERFNTKLRHN